MRQLRSCQKSSLQLLCSIKRLKRYITWSRQRKNLILNPGVAEHSQILCRCNCSKFFAQCQSYQNISRLHSRSNQLHLPQVENYEPTFRWYSSYQLGDKIRNLG